MRALEIDQRTGLRTPGPQWVAAFVSYLVQLEYPFELSREVRDGRRVTAGGVRASDDL